MTRQLKEEGEKQQQLRQRKRGRAQYTSSSTILNHI